MKSVIVHPTTPTTTTIVDVAVPRTLAPDEVLIEVHAAASNPKDWLHVVAKKQSYNSGDDLAGVVAGMGTDVTAFRIGDRVAALHSLGAPFGAYAQFAVARAHTTFKISGSMPFAEASTIPLVSMTAALTLFRRQGFTPPWHSAAPDSDLASERKPLLIYAASTALGTTIVKLAKLAGLGPIIAVGGGSSGYLRTLLREEDTFVDHRVGMSHVTHAVRAFVQTRGLRLRHAVDALSADNSWVSISRMLDHGGDGEGEGEGEGGVVSVFSGANRYTSPEAEVEAESKVSHDVKIVYTFVGSAHTGAYLAGMPCQPAPEEAHGDVSFAREFTAYIARLLDGDGAGDAASFAPHPHVLLPDGLDSMAEGLNALREGRSAGRKYVYRVA